MFRHWGLSKLNEHEYDGSIDEMKRADWLIERILFLEGLPNLQDLGKILVGEAPLEVLECDLALEMQAMASGQSATLTATFAGQVVMDGYLRLRLPA